MERRVWCPPDWLRLPDRGVSENAPGRNRRLPLGGRASVFTDDSDRRCVPLRRWRSGPSCPAVRRKPGSFSFRPSWSSWIGRLGVALFCFPTAHAGGIQVFVVRHFRKAKLDSARIWTICSRRFSRVKIRLASVRRQRGRSPKRSTCCRPCGYWTTTRNGSSCAPRLRDNRHAQPNGAPGDSLTRGG